MSQENVEVVRRSYAAFESGDVSVALDSADPDMITYRADPEARTWHGPDGFMQALADWTEGFDVFRATAEE
jgi:ketosteroid isomerase-like protein